MQNENSTIEGWVGLLNTKKWHYFINGRSLCRKWMYLGTLYEQGNDNSPDNCAACKKKLKERK